MDPLTLGVVAAALVVKASEKAGEKIVDAGAAALIQLMQWLRQQLSSDDGVTGAAELAKVEEVPDSPTWVRALAEAIDGRAAEDQKFKIELKTLIEQVRAAGVQVSPVSQIVIGDQNIQVAQAENVSVSVSRNTASMPPWPARGPVDSHG